MSLTNLNFENEIDLRARKALISELWTRDPESGDFARIYPGGGGGGTGDIPYWIKPESAAIGDLNRKTTVANDGVDVVNNVSGTACEITDIAITLGDAGGNSVLSKSTIDAANRVKNIAQDMAPASKKILLYDSTSKGITFGGQQTLPGWVQPTAATFSNGDQSTWLESNYFKLTGGLAETYIDADNLSFTKNSILNFDITRNAAESNEMQLRWMDSVGNLASKIGPGSIFGKKLFLPGVNGTIIEPGGVIAGYVDPAGALITTTRYGKLSPGSLYLKNSSGTQEVTITPTYLDIKENGVSNLFTKAGIIAANKVSSLGLNSTPSANFNTVIYDPTTKDLKYTPIVAPTTVPVTRRMVIGASSGINLPMLTDNLAGAFAGRSPVTNLLNDGDTLLLDTVNQAGFGYDTWYAIRVSSNTEAVVDCKVLMCSNTNYTVPNEGKTVVSEMYNTPYIIWHRTDADIVYSSGTLTIPARTLVFKLGNTNTTYSSGESFQGVISIKMIANSRTTVPA